MSKRAGYGLGAVGLALLAAVYFIPQKAESPAMTEQGLTETVAVPTPYAAQQETNTPCGEGESTAVKPARHPKAFKPRSLQQEKDRITKQITRAQERLEKVEAMSEKEWLNYQKQRYERREKLQAMSVEEKKAYSKKRRDWNKQMKEMTPEEKKDFLETNEKEMLPLEGED